MRQKKAHERTGRTGIIWTVTLGEMVKKKVAITLLSTNISENHWHIMCPLLLHFVHVRYDNLFLYQLLT